MTDSSRVVDINAKQKRYDRINKAYSEKLGKRKQSLDKITTSQAKTFNWLRHFWTNQTQACHSPMHVLCAKRYIR